MRQKSILSHILIILSLSSGFAQNADEEILMTVAKMDVEAGEFVRMFNKSLDPEYRVEIDEYLQQFIAFKLKVADAVEHGYDTTMAFREELNGYRNQLAQTWLTDPDIREKTLRKAYQRYLEEINASHILVNCPQNASPDDTLKAYGKAIEIRKRILGGEPFGEIALSESDDKSAMTNRGSLGYFTVFQMITPFEDAAYSLQPGTVSEPVRTPFGYHIIKVIDRRPSRGKIRVSHIMKSVPPGSDEQAVSKAKNEISQVYEKLGKGESFAKLASENSDHRESAANGGELNWFGAGEIINEFSEAAFSIKDTGEYTKPVRSPYGFHIIKLLEKKGPGTYEEAKPFLESRLNQTDLVSLGKKSFIDRLRKEYDFRVDPEVRNWFIKNTDTLIIRGKAKYPAHSIPKGNIYSFAGKSLSASDFASYLEKRDRAIETDNPSQFIDASVESLASEEIMKYEDSILEKKHPDFKYLMKEFHDGILLFEISSDKVWNRVQEDSAGLLLHYELNKDKFLSDRSIEGKVYTLRDTKGGVSLEKSFRKYARKQDADEKLLARFNKGSDTLLTITEGRWKAGDDPEIDNVEWMPGDHFITLNGFPAVLKIIKVNEPAPLPFREVQADIISSYQDWLNEEWIRELRGSFAVKTDEQVLKEVKKRLANE
ncbi:MAG: peptidylprolyl isomerase [Bacteroidales bacterium]|nr:peptidylprolyl isomerase [Bacteroidales bacterium]